MKMFTSFVIQIYHDPVVVSACVILLNKWGEKENVALFLSVSRSSLMDSQNNYDAPRRKLKFAPKAPPLRKPKLEVKTEARNFLRRFNENSMKARPKVEKKVSASQIAFGDEVKQLPSNHMVFPRLEAISTEVGVQHLML
ncbi:hypothetical protein Lal_00021038 [Lupinus albus]|nr:hypothetical protein Lal_00021038 [Lupinus albus]